MGDDDLTVVGTKLRVHGLQGLSMIGTSIVPKLIGGNTLPPSIMISDKGAAIVRAGKVV
jgi:choline dehydrogenase